MATFDQGLFQEIFSIHELPGEGVARQAAKESAKTGAAALESTWITT